MCDNKQRVDRLGWASVSRFSAYYLYIIKFDNNQNWNTVSLKNKITIKEKERKENVSNHYFSQILFEISISIWKLLNSIFHIHHFYQLIYLILILCSFNLNPNISLKTPERADNITTLIVVYKYGFALKPEILNGDSNSLRRSVASFSTLLETISSSFFFGFCSI